MIRSVVSGGKVEEERDAIVCEDVKALRHKMARVCCMAISSLSLVACHLPELNMRTSCV